MNRKERKRRVGLKVAAKRRRRKLAQREGERQHNRAESRYWGDYGGASPTRRMQRGLSGVPQGKNPQPLTPLPSVAKKRQARAEHEANS